MCEGAGSRDVSSAKRVTVDIQALNERYAVSGFREAYHELRGIASINQPLLGSLLLDSSRLFPTSLVSAMGPALPIRLELTSSQIGEVGQMLNDLDLEMRRAASYLATGSKRPLRERETVALLGARRTSLTTIFILVSGSIRETLVAAPLDLILATSWFWQHRLNHTMHRPPEPHASSQTSLTHIVRSARLALSSAGSTVVAMRLDPMIETGFEFRPVRSSSPW
jgi:hypothetical protein